STTNDFVVAAAAAEIARPATAARLLTMNMPLGEPVRPALPIHAVHQRAHRAFLVADKAVAGSEVSVRRDPEIARARPAGIRPVRAASAVLHGLDHARNCGALPC